MKNRKCRAPLSGVICIFCVMKYLFILISVFFMISCRDYTPRPTGYNRIDFPESRLKKYNFKSFSFEYPDYVVIDTLTSPAKGELWFNIVYPRYDAVIHCTYLPISSKDLSKAVEDSHQLAYSHTLKSEGINHIVYRNEGAGVSGLIYEIEGDVATPIQFFVTDSIKNFFRGSFYYSTKVNMDSVAPVTNHIKEDIRQMIDSFVWKND